MVTTSSYTFILLIFAFLVTIALVTLILKKTKKSQLRTFFLCDLVCILFLLVGLIAQIFFSTKFNVNPFYFEYFVYIGNCFLPITLFFTGLIFTKTKIEFKKHYLLLFIVPILSMLLLWTNDFHHLFYETYSVNLSETVYGPYMTVHLLYSYILLACGIIYLIHFSIKNAGFFSKQSIFIIIGCLIPLLVNIFSYFGIIESSVYMTSISFTITIAFFTFALFKLDFLSVTPIALQRIVDRMSDSYVVLNENNLIIDFNSSFLSTFKIKDQQTVRNTNIFGWSKYVQLPKLESSLEAVKLSPKTVSFEAYVERIDKYFNVELSNIVDKGMFLGTLILFKDVTQHMHDLDTIQSNQDRLIEKERFASLGQMIGGIAHNLKTPIMSISGAAEALTDLVNEYDTSIGDPEVTSLDHHDIARDMVSWVSKIKTHTAYMSDVITAVKGQAVETNDSISSEFTIDELVKRINILMKHELKHSLTELNVIDNGLNAFILHGDVNCLVQVINNLISNAIQSYNGEPDNKIDLIIEKTNNKSIALSVKDYGCGMSEEVQNKLFKEMITTKGKNGTGLGLFMSYSNIKAHFNGNISFESIPKKGTTFSVTLPCA